MELLDLALRGGAITVLALLAVLTMASQIGVQGRAAITAVAVTKSAFLLTSTAVALPFPIYVQNNLDLIASLSPTALTWMMVTIFIDTPLRRWPWMVASVIVSLALYLHFVAPGIGSICALLAVPLYGALLGLSLWSARDDLVERRCRARPIFAVAIAGTALMLTGLQAVGSMEIGTIQFALLQSVTIFALSLAVAIHFLQADLDMWPGPEDEAAPEPKHVPDTEAMDTALIGRIGEAMEDGIWREEGLTVGALATHLSVPEHRLRRAINQGLGFRNFSSFINAARIKAARAMLCDPAQSGTTILEIAYHVGFASLGPFNRAFRNETGMSPTEFRRTAFDHGPGESAPISSNLH